MQRAVYDKKKLQILQVAGEIFSKHGYSAAHIDDIASALNVTKGNIYYYFKSKAHILHALHELIFQRYQDALEEMGVTEAIDPAEKLKRTVNAHVKACCEDPIMTKVLLGGLLNELAALPRELQQDIHRKRKDYAEAFTALIAEIPPGKLKSRLPPRLIANCLLASMDSICIWYRKQKSNDSQVVAALAEQVLHGVLDGA
ncbi:MAG: TetR/AcrR family transcriptional regulator [Chloroflexi bacterium]|nr:TetR/AcrR family transcriptional regulator [Chloroflexota bacterium]